MNEILLANLFFIITGSAVLVVATFVCIVCYHLITLTKRARAILERVETSAESLLGDVYTLRDHIADYITKGTVFGKMLTAIVRAMSVPATHKNTAPRKKKIIVNEE